MKTLSISIICVFLFSGTQAQKHTWPNDTLLIINNVGGKNFIISDTDFLKAETFELNIEGLEIVEYTTFWFLHSGDAMSFKEKTNKITERFKVQIKKENSSIMELQQLKCVNKEGEIVSIKRGFVIHIKY